MRFHTGQGREGRDAGLPERLAAPFTRRRWLQSGGLSLLGGVAAPLLTGCQPPPVAPLKVGLNAWVGYDPLVLARERGLIDPRAVKVIELSSSSETLRHFRNHLLDAAALTLDEALRLADEGFEPRVVAVLSASAGADVVLAAPAVRSLADLRGRTVAVEATTVGALMLQRLLQAASLQQADVRVMNVVATQHLALLRAGRAEVSVSYEPLAGPMREAGFNPIFDSRQMPGDIVDVLLVHADVLRDRAPQVQALVAGWQRGLGVVQQEPERSAALLALGTDLTPAQYLAAFQGLAFYSPAQSLALLSGQPRALGRSAEPLTRTLQGMGLIHATPDWGRLLAPEAAQALAGAQEPRS